MHARRLLDIYEHSGGVSWTIAARLEETGIERSDVSSRLLTKALASKRLHDRVAEPPKSNKGKAGEEK